ncbi:hypothetical protein MCUN1_003265 [Malassezia cuniculi]|uniref:chitin deacetylase n=1 Tax=Malassezia cuniculi TaxID=948313 RepID=A0AAF0EY30_9BASI|nr:hypothetical protein MCUN1_003265 [Malassezia cuniculi]
MLHKWLLSSLALAAIASAHESSFEVRRSHALLRRQSTPSNAADAAKIYGIEQECTQYGDDNLTKMITDKQLPEASQIATIVDGDSEAQQVWKDIQSSGIIPSSVKVKTGTSGNMGIDPTAQSSYDKSDPDCWWTFNRCTEPKSDNIPTDISSCPEPSTWGLTFDDGPNCSHNEFYDYLQQQKLRATMFYIGTNIVNHPYQAQRVIADGHDVCVHTWSHHYMTTLSNEQVFAELYYTGKIIKAVLGVTPRCWRPPFGDVDDRVRAIAAGLGMRTILWQQDTNDWELGSGQATKDQIEGWYTNIINKASNESPIVLTHEISNATMSMFESQAPNIQKAYKNVVPLTACLNVTNPYPEDITYPDFKAFTSGTLDPKNKPDIASVKVDASATYSPVALSKQTQSGSYMSPGSGSGSSDSSGSSSSSSSGSGSNSNSSSSAFKIGAISAYATAITLASMAVVFL